MIIQTLDTLIHKKREAREAIGKHLLLVTTFKDGLIFGMKFNKDEDEKGQWLMEINATSIMAGIGDLGEFRTITFRVSNFCQETANLLGKHYLTGEGIIKFISGLLRGSFDKEGVAFAVNFLVIDWRNEKKPNLWFIDFDGSTEQLKNFAAAGGSDYQRILTKEEFDKLPPEEKVILNIQKEKMKKIGIPEEIIPPSAFCLEQPRKKAISYLKKEWKPNMKKEEAINLIRDALFECNPESPDKKIEITVIEYGKIKVKFFYFTKKEKEK